MPNGNNPYDYASDSEIERNAIRAFLDETRMLKLCKDTYNALMSLDADCLGVAKGVWNGDEMVWPIRDELCYNIARAITIIEKYKR